MTELPIPEIYVVLERGNLWINQVRPDDRPVTCLGKPALRTVGSKRDMERRVLQRNGIQLFNLRYWSDALPALVRRDEPLLIRYDPRDLSKLYVKAPDHSYLEAPYADIRLPPLSLWELRAARRFLAQRGDPRRNQKRQFCAHDELRRIAAKPVTETRRVRRQRGRREALAREQSLATTGSPRSVSK